MGNLTEPDPDGVQRRSERVATRWFATRAGKWVAAAVFALALWTYCSQAVMRLVTMGAEAKSEAQARKAVEDITTYADRVRQFAADCGRYPTTKEGLAALLRRPAGLKGWQGPYCDSAIPNDPWGHPYVYTCPGPGGSAFRILSFGSDGEPGGEGDAQDIIRDEDGSQSWTLVR